MCLTRRHDIPHNVTQYNNILHNVTQYNVIKDNNKLNAALSIINGSVVIMSVIYAECRKQIIMPSVIMLSVIMLSVVAPLSLE